MNFEENKISYYSIIPSYVRYDERLIPNAKLLYGEITALCNEKGYCWARNSYFAKLYKKSKDTISKWINQLVKYGYIESEIQYVENTKKVEQRYLKIVAENKITKYHQIDIEENKVSYYSVTPSSVRYDKKLTANAKLLYSEITALCNEKGYCWARNSYFAKLYKVSKVSISKWINQLIECGYIESEIKYVDDTKEIEKRILKLSDKNETMCSENHKTQDVNTENNSLVTYEKNTSYIGIDEKFNRGIDEKFNRGIDEKFKENNTILNNIIFNNTIT